MTGKKGCAWAQGSQDPPQSEDLMVSSPNLKRLQTSQFLAILIVKTKTFI